MCVVFFIISEHVNATTHKNLYKYKNKLKKVLPQKMGKADKTCYHPPPPHTR